MLSGNSRFIATSVSIVLLLSACEFDSSWTHNTNQGDNQYFEEPLSDDAQKYSQALETSNAFVESFARGRLEEAKGLLNSNLQAGISEEEFRLLHEQLLENFGPMLEYKPMQWGFATRSETPNVIASVKIIVHENAETFYVLTFEDDGIYEQILGFRVIEKSGEARIADAASHVLKSGD